MKIDAKLREAALTNLIGLGLTDAQAQTVIRSQMASPAEPKGQGLSIRNADDGAAELLVYDQIGPEWMGMVSASAIARALKEAGDKPVRVRINSPGGDVFEGLAAYNQLATRGNV